MFLYSHQHAIHSCSLVLFSFLLLHLCHFVIWVTKIREKTITITLRYPIYWITIEVPFVICQSALFVL